MKKILSNKYIKITGIILLIILAILFVPFYKGTNLVHVISDKVEYFALSEERQAVYDRMKIEYVNIKSRVTGTAPFNSGTESNADGVDVSDSDDYVRTFDVMKYTVELGISPNTEHSGVTASSVYEGGVIKVKAKLPNQGSPTLMRWEQDAWMQNVSYSNDKTEIYAEYHVPSGVSVTNANQNLTFTVKVDGYKKEVTSDMAPEFEIWMEGNKPDDATSSAPSVAQKDTRNTIISGKVSIDVDVKALNSYKNSYNDVVGNFVNYGVGLSLRQPNSNFSDLRGVEYPNGKIDLNLNEIYRYIHVDGDNTWKDVPSKNIILLDYGLNNEPKSGYIPASYKNVNVPCGKIGLCANSTSVFDSGKTVVEYNDGFKILFEDYRFNSDMFPVRRLNSTMDEIGPNVGYFATNSFQLFIPLYLMDDNNTYDYNYGLSLDSFSYHDTAFNKYVVNAQDEVLKSNNSYTISFSKRLRGTFTIYTRVYSGNTHEWEEASASLGSTIIPEFIFSASDGPYEGGAERFIIWNSSYATMKKYDSSKIINVTCNHGPVVTCPSLDTIEFQYGIYNNNPENGVLDDTDVQNADTSDFSWYSSYDEALSHGKIAAIFAVDHDVRGNGTTRRIFVKYDVTRDENLIGEVGIFLHKVKVYADESKITVYKPYLNQTFRKAIYDSNGNLVSSKNSYNLGTDFLVIGARSKVSIGTVDETNGTMKSTYDVQDGEIKIKLHPSLQSGTTASNEDIFSHETVVTAILPNGLSYKNGSGNKEPKSVTVNSDGTTTIEWEYHNWQVNRDAPEYSEITFTADISASLENNASLNLIGIITSDLDTSDDTKLEVNFRHSEYGVVISNLAGSKALKDIDKPIVEKNEKFNVTSTLGNNSEEILRNVKTIEILPTNHDENGSIFSGNYTSKITSGIANQKFFYTTKSISVIGLTEDKYGKLTIKDVDLENDSRWIEVGLNEEIPANATAIATLISELPAQSEGTFVMEVNPTGNKEADTYAFTLNMTSDNLQAAIKTNTVVTKVVSRSISGKAFIDDNRNGSYDTTDTLLANHVVKLLNSSGTVISSTQTNENGEYEFLNVEKGNYYVEFSIPDNYETITKGTSSKVNTNGRTDLITSLNVTPTNALLEVTNVDMGIRKIDAKINVSYVEYGNTSNVFDSTSIDKFYGDRYNLDTEYTPSIPDNYEFKEKTNNYTGTINQKETNVVYYYQKKDSKLTSSIEKTGTKEITSRSDTVEYQIIYKTKISDYLGEAKITIVDTLPYLIDVDNSNLDGGVYNASNKTITWTETRNIQSITEPEITIEKNVELSYTGVLPTSREMLNTVEGVVKLDNNERSVQNNFKTDIKIPGTIIVHYIEVDEEGNEIGEIIDPIETTDLVGEEFISDRKEFEGYELIEVPTTEEYEYLEELQEVVYKYEKIKVHVETVVHGIGGKIVGDEDVPYGDDSTKDKIVIEAEEGYQIASLRIGGEEIEIKGVQTKMVVEYFKEMKDDKLVEVTFKPIERIVNPQTGTVIQTILLLLSGMSVGTSLWYMYKRRYRIQD